MTINDAVAKTNQYRRLIKAAPVTVQFVSHDPNQPILSLAEKWLLYVPGREPQLLTAMALHDALYNLRAEARDYSMNT